MTRNPERLLVTGGCGFIGSAFVRAVLGRGKARVVNLDALTYAANPANLPNVDGCERYTFVHGDIADAQLVARLCDAHDIDAVVHFASESHVDRSIDAPETFVMTNVVGTVRLLDVIRARPHIHFHHVSTDEVYGSLGPDGRFTEASPYRPSSPYAASKAGADHLVRAYAHTYGVRATISSCSNNYGPYQFPEKLVPLMILHMIQGKPLPVYGDGRNVRDWLYVDDHVDAIWEILTRGAVGRTYNVGGGAELTNLEMLERLIGEVSRQTGRDAGALRDAITFVADRPGHDRRYAIDATRIRDELAWAPRHDLPRGLARTVAWYLENDAWVAGVSSRASEPRHRAPDT